MQPLGTVKFLNHCLTPSVPHGGQIIEQMSSFEGTFPVSFLLSAAWCIKASKSIRQS